VPGLDDLLAFVLRAVEVTPEYTPGRCLVVRSGPGACRACLDACPHEAVKIDKQVELDAVDCTGCGLCVRACPSEALTAPMKLEPAPGLRCSRVAGDAQSVRCLAQLSAADLVRLAGAGESVTLAHGACAGCKVGGAAVPAVVEATAARARELMALHDRRLTVNVSRQARLDAPSPTKRVSRRELFRGGLREVAHGAADALAPIVYEELHQLASALMRRERPDHTLQPTALVHDAFLKLVGQRETAWQGRKHFYGLAAAAMRRLLVDHARRRDAVKRDGGIPVTLDDAVLSDTGRPLELLALDEALQRLAALHERSARLVELRFFTGLEIDEAAEVLGIGRATAVRDWTFARAFLQRELRG